MLRFLFLLNFISLTFFVNAQKQPLTEEHYFGTKLTDLVQPLPVVLRFEDENNFVMMKGKEVLLVNAKSGIQTSYTNPKVEKQEKNNVAFKNNDIYFNDEQITFDTDIEKNPTLSPDEKLVAYTKNNNLFVYNIQNKTHKQITTDGSNLILNGYASWVYMEEILGRGSRYRAFWWSPDSKHIAFFRSDDTQVPEYVLTDDGGANGYVEKLRYPKPGDKNPEVKIGIANVTNGEKSWADFNEKDDQYFGLPYWKPDGSALLVQWMNRAQNELKIFNVDLISGKKKLFYEQKSATWINLDDEGTRLTFLSNQYFLLLSDESGYNHIYLHDKDGKRKLAVTQGELMVQSIVWHDDKEVIFLGTTKNNSTRIQVFRASLTRQNVKQLTSNDFNYGNVTVSPKGTYFTATYGNAQTPNKLIAIDKKGKSINIFDTKTEAFQNFDIALPEVFRIKSADGKFDLPIRIIMPLNVEAGKKYPVLVSIYGGPARNDVMDNWLLNGNQQWYAKEGLIQVVIDHRGSKHFGKAGDAYLFHNLGYWEITDYSTHIEWLIANKQADPERIAITGFSYGGYLSSMAVTLGAKYFTYAMAGGSVTDWSLYDSHYTERYMGTPQTNPEGYKKSSVMHYTNNYTGYLQLVHGLIDENVHPQNSIRLATDLQNKNKEFEYMLYSGNRHGIRGKQGVHYANMKTNFIYKHLLRKPTPKIALK